MKQWIVEYRFKKGHKPECVKKCKQCQKEFISNGPKEHCSDLCFLMLRRKIDDHGCWLWQGSKSKAGYGKTTNSKLIHRMAWEVFKGPIPEGKFVCHVCDIRNCFNPEHLFLSDHKGNMADCKRKGRSPKVFGEKHHWAKFTQEDILNVRDLMALGWNQREVAAMLEMAPTTVWAIYHRKIWPHLQSGGSP